MTDYQLGRLVFRLYQTKTYRGEALGQLQQAFPERADYTRLLGSLVTDGILQRTKDVPNKDVLVVLGQDQAAAEDIICCVDPFCYLSHLSAMEYHGLTDRLPKLLFVTSLPPPQWGRLATERMQKDLGAAGLASYLAAGLPPLRRLRLDKCQRKILSVHTRVQCDPGAYVTVQGKPRRVATIGRTFLDMLREPDLCGGIYHVLDLFAEEAPRYLRLIVDEIDRHGTTIDKVRAGYVFTAVSGTPELQTAMVMKGGVLLALRYRSRRHTADIDFSTDSGSTTASTSRSARPTCSSWRRATSSGPTAWSRWSRRSCGRSCNRKSATGFGARTSTTCTTC